jgi:hypothetical protein
MDDTPERRNAKMKQSEITTGMTARVKIGSRLALVTVERVIDRPGRRLQYQCVTGDTGRRITCTAARLRPDPVAQFKAAGLPGATAGTNGQPLVAAAPVAGMVANVSACMVEPLTGANRYNVERIVGTVHVSATWRAACRKVFSKLGTRGRLRTFPRPLRRGLWLAVAEAHRSNRDLYRSVMGYSEGLIVAAGAVEAAMAGDDAARSRVLAS